MPKKEKKIKKKKTTQGGPVSVGKGEDFELPEKDISSSLPPNVKVNVDSGSKDLRELIEKNIKWSQVIYEQNRKIKRKLTWMTVGSYLRLAIIVVPIVLGIIYLPPLFKDLLNQYSSILGIGGGSGLNIDSNLLQGIDLNDLFGQIGDVQ